MKTGIKIAMMTGLFVAAATLGQAEAAFQQGKLAELNVRYLDAIDYYQKALNLSADNTQYAEALQSVEDQLAAYDMLLKEPSTQNDGSKGEEWLKKGDYDQAIDFYEKELENALNHETCLH